MRFNNSFTGVFENWGRIYCFDTQHETGDFEAVLEKLKGNWFQAGYVPHKDDSAPLVVYGNFDMKRLDQTDFVQISMLEFVSQVDDFISENQPDKELIIDKVKIISYVRHCLKSLLEDEEFFVYKFRWH